MDCVRHGLHTERAMFGVQMMLASFFIFSNEKRRGNANSLYLMRNLVGSVGDEAAKEVQSSGGLIMRNHVASVENANIGEVTRVTDGTPGLTVGGRDGVVVSVDELVLSGPLHIVQHGGSTVVVADKIVLTVVENDGHGGEEIGNKVQIRALKVTLEVLVDTLVAILPGAVSDTELLANEVLVQPLGDGVKVVAERSVALLADIVNVDVSGTLEADLHDHIAVIEGRIVVTALDIRSAGLVLLVGRVHGGLVNLTVIVQEGSIRLGLDDGIHPTVSDGDTLQVDLNVAGGLVHLPDIVGNGGDIVACIRLTSNEEGQVAVLGELVQKVLHEGVGILGNLLLVGNVTYSNATRKLAFFVIFLDRSKKKFFWW
jgi:hypothetical protein